MKARSKQTYEVILTYEELKQLKWIVDYSAGRLADSENNVIYATHRTFADKLSSLLKGMA